MNSGAKNWVQTFSGVYLSNNAAGDSLLRCVLNNTEICGAFRRAAVQQAEDVLY